MLEKIALPFVLVMFLLAVNVSAYEITLWQDGTGSSPISSYVPAFLVNGDSCEVTITGYATATVSPARGYSLTSRYYSPYSTEIISGTKYKGFNETCLSFEESTGTEISSKDTYEAKTTLTYDSDSAINYIKVAYNCDTDSDLYMNFTQSRYDNDSEEYVPNMYHYTAKKNCVLVVPYEKENMMGAYQYVSDTCHSVTPDLLKTSTTTGGSDDNCFAYAYYFPIKTGTTGQLVYNLSCDSCDSKVGGVTHYDRGWYVYKFNDTAVFTQLSSGTTAQSQITLTADTEYVIMYFQSYYDLDSTESVTLYPPAYSNYDIYAYEPDYSNCTEYSECNEETGQKYRICYDVNEIAPPVFEYVDCFVTPSVDVELGFEEFTIIPDDTFWCGKAWLLCTDLLFLKNTYTPVGWYIDRTYKTSLAGYTASLEDYCIGTSETSFTGSKSLKCWSLPPDDEKPLEISTVAGDDVYCGAYNESREPEVVGLFNESLFVAYNVSFETPYVNLYWSAKKCASAPYQYQYGDCLGCCGDKCYGDCNESPTGWYTIKMADIGTGRTDYVNYPYSFYDQIGNNDTAQVIADDLSYSTVTLNYPTYITNITGVNFTDDMHIGFYFHPDGASTNSEVYITNVDDTIIYGSFNTGNSYVAWIWRNVTLENVPNGTTTVYIHDGAGAGYLTLIIDLITVEDYEEFVEVDTLFEFDEEAGLEWQEKKLDLTTLGIVPNHNYTIGFRFSPQYETTVSNCVYVDGVRGVYTGETTTLCESYCDDYDLYQARRQGEACLYTITENSPICRGVTENERYDSFCNGTTLNYFDNETGYWYELENALECLPDEDVLLEEELYEPPKALDDILITFGISAGSPLEGIRFFLSIFMLSTYLIIISGAVVTILPFFIAPKNSVNVSEAGLLGIVTIFIMTLALTVGGFYPAWIGWTIVALTGCVLGWTAREFIIPKKK